MGQLEDDLRHFMIDNFLYGRSEGLSNNDSFLGMGIIDSTGVLELVSFLEAHYGIVIEDSDLVPENLDSINELVRFVEKKRKQQSVLIPEILSPTPVCSD